MRQYIADSFFDNKGRLEIKNKDFKYLKQVLRVKVGDMMNVRIPDGTLHNTTVAQIDEQEKKIILEECADTEFNEKDITRGVKATEIESQRKVEYWLFMFIPKIQKFEQIVKQATECGVSVIIPVKGVYSEKNQIASIENEAKMERINKIIKEARQQSGSPVDTKVYMPVNLVDACKLWREKVFDEDAVAFYLSERQESSDSIYKAVSGKKLKSAAIVVGCEGGISADEVSLMNQTGLFIPVHFPGNILRCETAALYGMAALQNAIVSCSKS